MTMNSGPMINPPGRPDDSADALLFMILDYGQACFEHGAAKARFEAARARTALTDDDAVTAAGRLATIAYARVRLALTPMAPLRTRAAEPGE